MTTTNWTAEKTEDGYILTEPSGEGHLVYDYGQSSDLLARVCQWLVEPVVKQSVTDKMTPTTPSPIADQAAGAPDKHAEALTKWMREVKGNGIAITSLMRSAYRDGWDDRAALSTAPTTGSAPEVCSNVEVAHSNVEFEAYWVKVQVLSPFEFTHKESAREIWMASRGIDYGHS